MKAGIIGLGHGSRVLIESFKLNKIEVYGVTSKNYDKAVLVQKQKKIVKVYKNWKQLIKDKKISIVVIAVPPIYQINIINECIKENKIIFCEKPIGINLAKINKILLKLKKYKKNFIVDYIFAEHNAFDKFKKLLIQEKNINKGNVKVEFNTKSYVLKNNILNWKTKDAEGGGLINLYLPHIIDYLINFFGEISLVKYNAQNNKRNSKLFFELIFKNDIIAKIKIDANNSNQKHLISYKKNNTNIILINKGKDYAKNFSLSFTNRYKKTKYIKYNYNIRYFKKDSRIYLSSFLAKKLIKTFNKKIQIKNINRYSYIEIILDKIRVSIKNKKDQKVVQ